MGVLFRNLGQPLIEGKWMSRFSIYVRQGRVIQFGTAIELGRIWVSSFAIWDSHKLRENGCPVFPFPPVTRPHQRPRRVARADRPG